MKNRALLFCAGLLAVCLGLFADTGPVNAQSLLLHNPGWNMNTGFDSTAVEGPADLKEVDWSRWIATQAGHDPVSTTEVRTRSGKRVDILTCCEAIEVEWAPKWYQAIGQATFYSIETGRQPAIILLSYGDEEKEILLCQAVCVRCGIRLYVQRIPRPAESKLEKPAPPVLKAVPDSIGTVPILLVRKM